MHCTICASVDLQFAFEVTGYGLTRCKRCGHLFVVDRVDPLELDQAYGKEYYVAGETKGCGYDDYLRDMPTRIRGFEDRLAQIERRCGKHGRLLDYGCAVGLFVKVAADAGWEATGYDRSEWAAQYGRDVWGLDIICGDGSAPPDFNQQFDVVTMWDVLEHLEHPRQVMELVSGWIKPGGMLVLNTVNSSSVGAKLAGPNWRHVAPPHHLQYFSRKSLVHLLSHSGFDLLVLANEGVMLGAERRDRPLVGMQSWVERACTHWRARPVATTLNLLDEVQVVARKRQQGNASKETR